MTKNPLINAGAALGYIGLVVLLMNYLSKHFADQESEIIGPILFLSLFTLSASVMGYIFVFQPFRMYIDGDKIGGVKFFLQTVGTFAAITVVVLLAALLIR